MRKKINNQKSFKKILHKYGVEITGGTFGLLLASVIIMVFHLSHLEGLLLHFIGIFLGVLISINIVYLIRLKDINETVKIDISCLKECKSFGKERFNIEKKLMNKYHVNMQEELSKLRSGNAQLSLYEYEQILQFLLEALEDSRDNKLYIEGTCLVLPDMFDVHGTYANIFNKLNQKSGSNLDRKFVRILCDHNKHNLVQAIKNNKNSFKDFCKWNLDTGFDLLIFKGNYDFIRREHNLPFNDFLIYNNKITFGGDVSEAEKTNKLANSDEAIISNAGLDHSRTERFVTLLNHIKNDNRCVKIDLHDKHNVFDETLSFLNAT